MSEILAISDGSIKIGHDDGSIVNLPIGTVQFAHPQVGDQVRVYTDEDTVIVKRIASASHNTVNGDQRQINKIVYIVITFFLGGLGIHRFMRGQVGLGVLMILFGWLTLGIWWLIEFIISLTKLSVYPGDDYVFTSDGRFVK